MGLTKLNNQSLSAVTAAGLPSGTVLQVVQTLHTATVDFTSTTHTEYSGITTSITPKATGSHILCKVVLTGGNNHNAGLWYETFLYRDSTSNLVQDQRIYFNAQYEVIGPRPFYDVIDTTDTTAGTSRTYKVYIAVESGSGKFRINRAHVNKT